MGAQEDLNVAMTIPQAFAAGDWSALATVLSPETTLESPVMQGRGPEQILQYFQGLKSAFPDMAAKVVSAVTSEHTVALELRSEGTHTEPMHTPRGMLPATGRQVVIKLAFFCEISNGKIMAIREYLDTAGFMAQLGFGAPAQAQANS